MSNEKQEPKTWKEIESDFRKYRQSLDGVETISAYTYYLQNIAKLTPPSVEQPSEGQDDDIDDKMEQWISSVAKPRALIKQAIEFGYNLRRGSEPSVDGELLEALKWYCDRHSSATLAHIKFKELITKYEGREGSAPQEPKAEQPIEGHIGMGISKLTILPSTVEVQSLIAENKKLKE